MKKYLVVILLFVCSLAQSQTVRVLVGLDANSRPGFLYRDTVYSLSNTANQYWTGFGTWGNFFDTARRAISLTTTGTSGAATYTQATGVFNIPVYGAGTGTVTSVAMSVPSLLSVAGSPITTSGTLAVTWTGIAQGDLLYGSAANTLTVLNKDANATRYLSNQGTSNNPSWNQVNLANGVTGVLPIANGGTNNGSLVVSTGTIYYGDGTKLLGLATGTNGQHLVLKAGVPFWGDTTAVSASSGWLTTGNAGTTVGTNFLGTTDNVNLMFKRFSMPAGLLDSSTSVTGITAFGVGALFSNTALAANTAYGFHALFATTGVNTVSNSAFGNLALAANTSGLRNSSFGQAALKTSTTVSDNAAFGYNALTLSTTANNTAVGSGALAGQTTGSGNTAVGQGTITTATDGINNTAIGFGAGANLKGFGNIAIGYISLAGTVSGATNIAIGYNGTLGGITSGASNIAIGRESMITNSTASNSTAVGVTSGNLSTGANNTFLGAKSGTYITSETGVYILNSIDRINKAGDQTASPFYSQQTALAANITTLNGKIGQNHLSPTSYLHLTRGTTAASSAPMKFDVPTVSLATTAAAGTGAIATLTFAAQTEPPFAVGSTIVVAGVTPSGYNATATVTAVSTTTVSYSNATSGVQTVAGTIAQGALLTTPERGAMETNASSELIYSTNTSAESRGYVSLNRYVAKTGTYTATTDDGTINCTSGTFTVTLPTAVGAAGRIYIVTNSGAGTITVGTTSSQTFANVVATPTTLSMATVGARTVQSDGANWLLLSSL